MASSLLMTTTRAGSNLDASSASGNEQQISDFLTLQSLTNFGAMTGAITTVWYGLQRLAPSTFSGVWVPYAFAMLFGVVSITISLEGLKKDGALQTGTVAGAAFVAFINALVLASAVVGVAVSTQPL